MNIPLNDVFGRLNKRLVEISYGKYAPEDGLSLLDGISLSDAKETMFYIEKK